MELNRKRGSTFLSPEVNGSKILTGDFINAPGLAAGINEYSRNPDVIAPACYTPTVHVIGAIKTSKTAAVLDSTCDAPVMYRRRFGSIPVEIAGAPEPRNVAAA